MNNQIEITNFIKQIILKIETCNWNEARQIWYTKIMKMNVRNKQQISFFGTVEDMFLKYMYIYQKHDMIQHCSTGCIKDKSILSERSDILHFARKKNNKVEIVSDISNKCLNCQNQIAFDVRFVYEPCFLFIETNSHLKVNELPKTIVLNNKIFKLLSMILFKKEIKHFVSIFEIQNNKYLVDDLKNNEALHLPEDNEMLLWNICSAFYYLI
jgi:hypothetical protein